MVTTIKTRKVQLMQKRTRDSGACLKAQCKQNLSSPIPAMMFHIHSPEDARQCDRSCSAILAEYL